MTEEERDLSYFEQSTLTEHSNSPNCMQKIKLEDHQGKKKR